MARDIASDSFDSVDSGDSLSKVPVRTAFATLATRVTMTIITITVSLGSLINSLLLCFLANHRFESLTFSKLHYLRFAVSVSFVFIPINFAFNNRNKETFILRRIS